MSVSTRNVFCVHNRVILRFTIRRHLFLIGTSFYFATIGKRRLNEKNNYLDRNWIIYLWWWIMSHILPNIILNLTSNWNYVKRSISPKKMIIHWIFEDKPGHEFPTRLCWSKARRFSGLLSPISNQNNFLLKVSDT